MLRTRSPESFRSVIDRCRREGSLVRVMGAHDALGGLLAQRAGFDAVWSSSFEVSAARCLPDASLLSMTEYLQAAQHIQRAVDVPVVADCDTGYGNALNVAHMVREYEAAGITAVCIEDKRFPKINSFADAEHDLVDTEEFAARLAVAKASQRSADFYVIARTEALINGLGVDAALERCEAYVDAGADAVLVHSKRPDHLEVAEFAERWERRAPLVVVPTTYAYWAADDISAAGISTVIYANQGLRATVTALEGTCRRILAEGSTQGLESSISSVKTVFALQDQVAWQALEHARAPEAAGASR